MERKDKIAILEAVSAGSVPAEVLRPITANLFKEDKPGIFIKDGKQYTKAEYNSFCEKVRIIGEKRSAILPGAISCDPIITIYRPVRSKHKTPDQEPEAVQQQTVDIPSEIIQASEVPDNTEKVEAVIIEDKEKPKTFNLKGERIDLDRARKMNEWKKLNYDL